jgi:divalent metal cation (Fe/Co/Zn/Cd) transporter
MSTEPTIERPQLLQVAAGPLRAQAAARTAAAGRLRTLAWLGIGWHALEFAVAIAAGLAASSIALIGFGADSLVEAAAGAVVLWRVSGRRATSAHAERRAQSLVAASFALLAVYVAVESVRSLVGGEHPDPSPAGIGLALVTLATMPLLARAKRRAAVQMGSAAAHAEATQNTLCAWLSVALLVGLGANAALGWWWADPLAALAVAAVAAREAADLRRGRACDCC